MNPVEMAVVHRPNDSGIELPPGASAKDLAPTDYKPVEMPDVGVEPASIPRPGDVGLDLPAGASADKLTPADYRPVEMEP